MWYVEKLDPESEIVVVRGRAPRAGGRRRRGRRAARQGLARRLVKRGARDRRRVVGGPAVSSYKWNLPPPHGRPFLGMERR